MCLLESQPQAGEGLVSQAWAVEASPGYRRAYGTARSLWPRLGRGLLVGFTPLCWALPVSRQRWVLLLRVVLRAFVVDAWARQGCFLMCNTHSCYLLTSSTVLGKTLDSPCLIYLKCAPERRGRLPAQPDSGLGVGGWCVPKGEFLNLCVPLLLS